MQDFMNHFDDQQIALALNLDEVSLDMIARFDTIDQESMSQDDQEFIDEITDIMDDMQKKIDDRDYLVLTDGEAEEAWEEYQDSYIEDFIEPKFDEIGLSMAYFNAEVYKRDVSSDGRGHCLAGYDGNEEEEEVNGITYFIYRNQ